MKNINIKSKVENGEVIEAFRKISTSSGDWCGCWDGDVDGYFPEQQKRVEAFITNALNQQREDLIEKIKDEYSEFLCKEWVEVATPHNFEAGAINCTAFDEFLTKLGK